MRYLVDEAGIGVAIASFGSYPTIKSYLDLAFPAPDANGAPFFTRENTSTPESVGYRDGCSVPDGKLPQLFDLIERYGCRREEVPVAAAVGLLRPVVGGVLTWPGFHLCAGAFL